MRVNISVDADMHREAKRRLAVLDSTFSGFVEDQLAMFLRATDSLIPVLDAMESGDASPAQIKAMLRGFLSSSTSIIGSQLGQFGELTQEIQAAIDSKEENTHK